MLAFHLSYLQSSLHTLEQMLHSIQESIKKFDHLELFRLLRNAQQLFIHADNYARTHLATITSLPSVVFLSIFRFLNVSERNCTQLVCKVWYHVWKLPIVQHAIPKMTSGVLVTSFHTTRKPYGIASWNTQIFVRCDKRLSVYANYGKVLVREWPIRNGSMSLAIDKNGLLYLPVEGHQIEVYTQDGILVRYWICVAPYALAVTDDHVIVSSSFLKQIFRFTKEGKLVQKWNHEGYPRKLVVAQDEIFITDASHQVRVFSKDGKQLRQWGMKGSNPGQFNNVHGIAISKDLVYVVDTENDRVQVFDRIGKYLFQLNSQLKTLCSVTICNDYAFVTDRQSRTVQIFELN